MNPNTEFELLTQKIYQKLVNNDVLKPTKVQHNVKLKGNSGCEHQIDVYWEYEIAGNLHRVAIECKNYNTKVKVGGVRAFYGVLKDLNNVNGIMVSNQGYQKSALEFAAHYGISLKQLRRPRADEVIGEVNMKSHLCLRHRVFLIDEGWIADHNFDIERLRQFYASFQVKKSKYWLSATHFPIETKDHIIRDSSGNQISSIEELERQLPEQLAFPITFSFEDGWLESKHWGSVRIKEVKFEEENEIQEIIINLAAEDFVEAILEDAICGKMDYVSKY